MTLVRESQCVCVRVSERERVCERACVRVSRQRDARGINEIPQIKKGKLVAVAVAAAAVTAVAAVPAGSCCCCRGVVRVLQLLLCTHTVAMMKTHSQLLMLLPLHATTTATTTRTCF